MKVEYRVKPVTRYIVTRFHADGTTGAVEQRGEYENGEVAYEVAYALCKAEHDASGQPVESVNFVYPRIPDGVSIPPKA